MSKDVSPCRDKSKKALAIPTYKPSFRPMAGNGGVYLDLNFRASSDEARALVELMRMKNKVGVWSRNALGSLAADMIKVVAAGAGEYGFRELGRDTFSDASVGYKSFMNALRIMEAGGFVKVSRAPKMLPLPGDDTAQATTFHPMPAFLSALDTVGIVATEWGKHFEPAPRPASLREPIVLRADAKPLQKKPWMNARGRLMKVDKTDPKVVALTEQVNAINAFMVDKVIEPAGCHRAFKRIFNQGDVSGVHYDRGGRLYSIGNSYQVRDKEEFPRKDMRINGEPIVEVDISASHLTIVHALLTEPLPSGSDLYEGLELGGRPIPRYVAKVWVTNTLGLGKWLARWSPASVKKAAEEKPSIALKMYPVSKLNTIMRHHFPVLDMWAASDIRWGQLQYLESCAIVDTVYTLMSEHDVVALPLHDAVIVPNSKQYVAKDVLSKAYQKHVGVMPSVKIK